MIATCTAPIGADTLLDYWTEDLQAARAGEVEEHVFACEGCATRLAELETIASGVRRLTAAGRFRAAVTSSVVDLLAAGGLRIRTYRPRRGETIPCGAAPEDQLLVARFPAALAGVSRLDLSLCDERWTERQRLEDVPVDRRREEVVFAERVDSPELRVASILRIRLVAVEGGMERELGRFALAHDPRGPPGTFAE